MSSNLPNQQRRNQYTADGATSTFTYSFLIENETDLNVYVTPAGQEANPATDIMALGDDYTVTGTGTTNGGTVVFLVNPDLSAEITIDGNGMPFTASTNFAAPTTFDGASLDNAIQNIVMMAQQNRTNFLTYGLRYEVNAITGNPAINVLPQLVEQNSVWMLIGDQIIAVTLSDDPSAAALRSDLISQVQGIDGASIIGYWNILNPCTVHEKLDDLMNVVGNNLFINDSFNIWQRGTEFDIANTGRTYTADRWYAVKAGSESAASVQLISNDDPQGGQYAYEFDRTVGDTGTTDVIIAQTIENVTISNDQYFTVAIRARISEGEIQCSLVYRQIFAGGETNTVVIASEITLSADWQTYTYTFQADAFAGKSYDQNSGFDVQLVTGDISEGYVVDISRFKIDAGITGIAFNPVNAADEMDRCLRYYEKSFDTTPASNNAGAIYYEQSPESLGVRGRTFLAAKRIVPTMVCYSPVTGASGMGRDVTTSADFAMSFSGPVSATTKTFTGIPTTAQSSSDVIAYHFTADAEFYA